MFTLCRSELSIDAHIKGVTFCADVSQFICGDLSKFICEDLSKFIYVEIFENSYGRNFLVLMESTRLAESEAEN